MERSKQRLEFYTIVEQLYRYGYGNKTKAQINSLPFITNQDQLVYELSLVNEMASLIKRFGKLSFYHDYDRYEVLNKIMISQTLVKEEFRDIFEFTSLSEEIRHHLLKYSEGYLELNYLSKQIVDLGDVKKIGNNYFNFDYELFDHVSPKLKELRSKLKRLNRQVDDTIVKTINKYEKYLTEKMSVMRHGRNCLPVNISYKNNVNGIIHDYSASYQTAYIEPIELLNVVNDLENTKVLIQNEEIKIYHEITLKLKDYYHEFYQNFELINKVDFIHAKASYANEINAVMPHFSINDEHILKNARHPLLPKESCVPITLKFSPENKIILLTGANTGGKTVSLKTLGLITLMLQSGLLIPVDESSRVRLFTNIFIDVGDEQSIIESLSTFSAHLTNLKTMLNELSNNSLILIDELGSGTDPKEGSSIAKAIMDEILKFNLKALITTHYSELKEYGLSQNPTIKLARLKFNLETLTPEYEIEYDLVGASHALLIAKRLGFNKEVVKNAEEHFESSKTDLEKVQEVLTGKEENLKDREEKLIKQIESFQNTITKFEQEQTKWEADKQKYLISLTNELKGQYDPLIKRANELIDKLKDQLSQKEIAELKGSLNLVEEKPEIDLTPLKKGDYVYITKYDQYGKINKLSKDLYYVSIGNFSLSFKREDLILQKEEPDQVTKNKKETPPMKSHVETKSVSKEASYEVDLRGIRYVEVNDFLDQAVDRAYLANLPSLKVIHGYGTGAIRKAVLEYLKKSPYIKEYRSGNEKEGMLGVTIIYLK